mgnify:CR=1 FL=1
MGGKESCIEAVNNKFNGYYKPGILKNWTPPKLESLPED